MNQTSRQTPFRLFLLPFYFYLGVTPLAYGDHFDDQTAEMIAKATESKSARKLESISFKELAEATHPIEGASASVFIVVKTDESRWSKLLLRIGQKKREGSDPIDVLIVERLVTFASTSRIQADRKDIYVYSGLGMDLDQGQIVPPGLSDDFQLQKKEKGSLLAFSKNASAFILAEAPVPAREKGKGPRAGAVQLDDFNGTFRLDADGKATGELTLKVDEDGVVTGSYRSEQTGNSYSVSGKAGNPNHKLTFKITFPMTEQEFEGYLFTKGKAKIAGTTKTLNRTFGFIAERKN